MPHIPVCLWVLVVIIGVPLAIGVAASLLRLFAVVLGVWLVFFCFFARMFGRPQPKIQLFIEELIDFIERAPRGLW